MQVSLAVVFITVLSPPIFVILPYGIYGPIGLRENKATIRV